MSGITSTLTLSDLAVMNGALLNLGSSAIVMPSALRAPENSEKSSLPICTLRPRASCALDCSMGRKLSALMKKGMISSRTMMTATTMPTILTGLLTATPPNVQFGNPEARVPSPSLPPCQAPTKPGPRVPHVWRCSRKQRSHGCPRSRGFRDLGFLKLILSRRMFGVLTRLEAPRHAREHSHPVPQSRNQDVKRASGSHRVLLDQCSTAAAFSCSPRSVSPDIFMPPRRA